MTFDPTRLIKLSFEELKERIKSMNYDELQQLIKDIDELLPTIKERQWVRNVESQETEILDLIEELRQETGRNYQLTLNGYAVQKRKK